VCRLGVEQIDVHAEVGHAAAQHVDRPATGQLVR
jgi:hypothetical protein